MNRTVKFVGTAVCLFLAVACSTGESAGKSDPPTAKFEQVIAMTSAQASERSKEVQASIASMRKAHRKRLEGLFDQLKRQCLKEPDIGAVSRANDLEEIVNLSGPDGSAVETVEAYANLFSRDSTKEIVRQIAGTIRSHEDEVAGLENTIPANVIWWKIQDQNTRANKIIDSSRWVIQCLPPEGSLPDSEKLISRSRVFELLALMENRAPDCTTEGEVAAKDLSALLPLYERIVAATGVYPEEAADAKKSMKAVKNRIEQRTAIRKVNQTTLFNFHKSFLEEMPERLETASQIATFGKQVQDARKRDAAQWSIPGVETLYARWQRDSFKYLMDGGLSAQIKKLRDTYYWEGSDWRNAVRDTSRENLEGLRSLLDGRTISPEGFEAIEEIEQLLIPVLDKALKEKK